jgi:hypothetical protein
VLEISDGQWADAERALDRQLPADLRELLTEVGDEELLGGNLSVYPLVPPEGDDEALTLTTASDLLRSWDWPVPDELVIFGSNGQDESFGLWVPKDGGARPLVVEIGEVFEDACLAVVGDDLESFERGWVAYYVLMLGEPDDISTMVKEFELPDELTSLDGDAGEDEFYAILQWANPGLPDPRPDPYERGLTAAQVDEIARSGPSPGSPAPGSDRR